MESINPHRLPGGIAPSHYALRLRPDIEAASFTGSVVITAHVQEPTSTIVMNAIELEIAAVSVRRDGAEFAAAFELDDDTERLHLQLDAPLDAGGVEIVVEFHGILNDKLHGFYRSSYTDEAGTEHTIATTQFESTNARRCFPCWDEPNIKATFGVTLEVPDHMLAVSAMAETARRPLESGWVEVTFADTPIMSTYLLAFVVGELEASPPVDVDGVPLRVVHRPGRGHEVAFARDAAVFCLRWLTDYFGVPYFGDKIDLIAIPDFAFGAMENTGCVIFREVLLLIDPETTTQPEQQRSVAVVAHELAHMWFGNLVTMQWWEGLWLKEAFATFMETSATDAYRPDWKVWESFALDRSAAYDVDALHSTRAIEYEVHSPADAEGMYDVLTYEKGASVVRMLEQFVGPDRFREGIRHYMRTHAYGNTVTSDLWNAIESATELPVDNIMHEWIYQGGFPLVDIAVVDGHLSLRQQPFQLLEGSNGDLDEWQIPLTIQAGSERSPVLMAPHGRVELDDPEAVVIVDPENHGFFRVRYDAALSARLAGKLMDLTPGQRYSLFDDLFDLVLAGRASVRDFVNLARAIRADTSPPLWTAVATGFSTLHHVCADRGQQALVGRVWAGIARPELDSLGFERAGPDEDPLTNEVRAALYSGLGSMSDDRDVIAHANKIFDGSIETENASLESAAVRVVASNGDRTVYDEVFDRFRAATSPQVERRYLFSLARFDDPSAIADLCDRALDGSVRSQDAAPLLGVALANRWHGETVWQFIVAHWDHILHTVPGNSVSRMLSGVRWLEHGDTPAVHDFLAAHPVPQARLAIAQHLERLDVHVGLRARLAAELAAL